ncbi:MAG TPA: HAD family hydrolase [Acidobacteriaceae bacterium]|jgi:phosphoglycolate phosphatase-like HAD superfamily hydrolase
MCVNTLGRAWDAFDAYLCDIDGTLMNCTDAVHYFAFNDAISAVAQRPLTIDGIVAHGNVDIGILRDAFARAGVAEEQWRARLPEILDHMRSFVVERQSEFCISVLPSVRETLEHLRARGAILGTATGNLQAIGEAKLNRAGLLELFDFGGWSDACETRAQVFREAAEKAGSLAQTEAAICVIGDTPADVQAARANNLKVISVATGIYSYEALAAEAPDLLVHSLTELHESTVVLPTQRIK